MKKTLVWLLILAMALTALGGCAPLSGRSSLEEGAAALPADSPYAFRNLADMLESDYDVDMDRVVIRDGKTGEALASLTVEKDGEKLDALADMYSDLASDLALSLVAIMDSYDSDMGPAAGTPFQSKVRFARPRHGKAAYQLDFYCIDRDAAHPGASFLLLSVTSYEDNQLSVRPREKLFADAHNLPGLLEFGISVSGSAIEDFNHSLALAIESK